MSDSKENTVSIRVSSALLDKLKDEQHDQRKRGEREQTYAEILDSAWASFEQRGRGNASRTGTLSKNNNDPPETWVYNSEIVLDAVQKIAEMGKSMAVVTEQLRTSIEGIQPHVVVAKHADQRPPIMSAEDAEDTVAESFDIARELEATIGVSAKAGKRNHKKLSGTGT